MFIAYLIPKHDYHLVIEDGIGFIAASANREFALAKLREQVRGGTLTDEEIDEIYEDHALHVTEL